jgi:hypothetical protein
MANTTNFNWETPDDTDLVKDGAAAIRTLAGAIDTSLVDLKGGTTGQVLSKATGTDMDFTWVTSDDANAIQNAIVDAKGDIVAASANDTPARLAVGTDNHRLIAASGETTGLKYVADTQNTVIDAEGDLLVGDSADTLQRLAIGSNTHVLTVDTAVDGKIKWAAPAGGSSFAGVSAYKSTGQSINNSSFTAITFDSENFDSNTYHDNSTNNTRLTVPAGKAGYYSVNGSLTFAGNTTGLRIVLLRKNGGETNYPISMPSVVANDVRLPFVYTIYLDVADYVEVHGWQNSGGALNVQGGITDSTFSMYLIGA